MATNRLYVLIFGAFLIILAMAGLYLDINFSGWVLAAGILSAVAAINDDETELPQERLARAWRAGFEASEDGEQLMDNPYV